VFYVHIVLCTCSIYLLFYVHVVLYTYCSMYMLFYIPVVLYTYCSIYILFYVHIVLMVDLSSKFSIDILTAIILCCNFMHCVYIDSNATSYVCVYSKMSWCLLCRFGEQFPARIFEQLGEWNGVQ
jgi:hypothetical protein